MGRFINADALISTGQGILGNNMFAYCLNNPVIYADHSGLSTREKTVTPFFIVIIMDDGCGSGAGQNAGGGVSPGLWFVGWLISMWEILDKLDQDRDTEDNDAIYCAARVVDDQLIIDSTPMSFDEAYNWVVFTAMNYNVSFSSNWGLYTEHEKDAISMTIKLGGADPVWDKGQPGQYRHYHVYGRNLFSKYKHFHVWYGQPN